MNSYWKKKKQNNNIQYVQWLGWRMCHATQLRDLGFVYELMMNMSNSHGQSNHHIEIFHIRVIEPNVSVLRSAAYECVCA